MGPEYDIEFALDALRKRFFHINYRVQEGVRLTPTDQFLYNVIPALDDLLRDVYDHMHNPFEQHESLEEEYQLHLALARKILESEPNANR